MTDQDLRRAFEEGRRVGFEAGFERGRQVGWEQARREGGQAPPQGPAGAWLGPRAPVPPGRGQPPPTWARPVALTPQQQEEARRQASTRNLNGLLYVASFLLVGASAALLGGALPSTAKVVGVWALAGLFYGGGLLLFHTVERLRAAAVAFTWTGLAIVPFGGAALASYGGLSPRLAWLLTSVLAMAALAGAVLSLRQHPLAHLSVLSVFSTALSSVALLDVPILWMLLACLAIAIAATALRPALAADGLAAMYRRPTDLVTWGVAPLAVLVAWTGRVGDLAAVSAASALQYGVAWLVDRTYLRQVVARLFIVVCLVAGIVALVTDREPVRALLITLVGLSSVAVTLWLLRAAIARRPATPPPPAARGVGHHDHQVTLEWGMLALGLLVMAVSPAFVSPYVPSPVWLVIPVLVTVAAATAAVTLRSLTMAFVTAASTIAIPVGAAAMTAPGWEPIASTVVAVIVLVALPLVRRPPCPAWTTVGGLTAVAHFLVGALHETHGSGVQAVLAAVAAVGIIAVAELVGVRPLRALALVPVWMTAHHALVAADVEQQWRFLLPSVLILGVATAWSAYDDRRARPSTLSVTLAVAAALAGLSVGVISAIAERASTSQLLGYGALIIALVVVTAAMLTSSDRRRLVAAALVTVHAVTALAVALSMRSAPAGVVPMLVAGAAALVIAAKASAPRAAPPWSVAVVVSQCLAGLAIAAYGPAPTDIMTVAYAHAVALVVASTYVALGRERDSVLAAALAVPTILVGLAALGVGGWYSMVFLVEQVGILVLGALLSKRWALWWGIVTSTLAVVYFLRDHLVLELILLAALLIVIAVWRLLRPGRTPQAPAPPPRGPLPPQGPRG